MRRWETIFFSLVLPLLCSGIRNPGVSSRGRKLTNKIPRCGGQNQNDKKHEILEEKVHYSRWRTVFSRLVRYPSGKIVDFDVVGQLGSERAVLIFAWDTTTKTTTLISEYMPGAHSVKYGIAAGLVEYSKHSNNGAGDEDDPTLTAARHELEEECHLVGGSWIQLTADTVMDKYATTVVRVYLVLDPQRTSNPKPLDDEEEITIIPNVEIPEVLDLIAKGEMNVVGGWACLVAIQKLREMGEIQ